MRLFTKSALLVAAIAVPSFLCSAELKGLNVLTVIAHPNFAFYFEQYNTANNGFQVDQE